MSSPRPLRDMIQDVLDAGLSVTGIVREPDGRIELLTAPQGKVVTFDPLQAAREKRDASKGKRNAHT